MQKILLKKTMLISLLFFLSLSFLPAQTSNDPALFPIIHNFSSRNFSNVPVSNAQIEMLVQAGLRAPSAGNRQPWLITVVRDINLARQILPNIVDGNILVVISGVGDGQTNGAVMLDCGLAAQNMFIAGQAMGLGARQYTNPGLIRSTNNLKAELGMPENHNAIIVTQFGRLPPGVDVIGSASPRAAPETRVIYR